MTAYSDDEIAGPVGVGGWMYLFLFGFAFVSPLMLVFSSYANLYGDPQVAEVFADQWAAYQVVEWSLVVASLALIAYVVWRLYNVFNPMTVRITLVAIPLLGLGLMAIDILVTAAMLDVEIGLLVEGIGTDLGRGIVYCVIWCSYFAVSQRVRNTYYRQDHAGLEGVFE